jgi:lipopolysaccharide assembly protein A
MRALVWLIRAALFVLLFAFALNNQHEAHLNGFFGREWRGPMVFVVLAALGLGVGLGVLAMLPGWWRQRRAVQRADAGAAPPPDTSALPPLPDVPLTQPSRDGI